MPPSDGQKRYDRFMELVKKAYPGNYKKEEVYKIGYNLWRKVKIDEAEYKRVSNDLTAHSAREKKKNITFWTQQTKKRPTTADAQNKEDTQSKSELQNTSEVNTLVVAEEKRPNSSDGSVPSKVVAVDDADQCDAPAPDKTRTEERKLKVHIASLVQLKNTGMSAVTVQQIKDKEKQLSFKDQCLKT